MIGLGKAIAAAITYIFGFLIFKVVAGAVGTTNWSPMSIALIAGVPVVILAVGVASMLIRPSPYKEQVQQLKKNVKSQ